MDHQMFESKVAERAGVPPDQAQALIRATLQTLAERITGGEAHDLAAQLPKQMKEWLEKDPGAPAESFGLEEVHPAGRRPRSRAVRTGEGGRQSGLRDPARGRQRR